MIGKTSYIFFCNKISKRNVNNAVMPRKRSTNVAATTDEAAFVSRANWKVRIKSPPIIEGRKLVKKRTNGNVRLVNNRFSLDQDDIF